VQYHGPTNPEALLRDWFPKASGLITMSRHDEGRPQVMIEAMAAGLPVLASQLSAHCDLLQHRQTGWIAEDAQSVAQGLAWLEQPANNSAVGQAASDYVRATAGTWLDCAERYAQAYRSLIADRR
jgi:glycosyltransferase involved in cell wall biosynthesis